MQLHGLAWDARGERLALATSAADPSPTPYPNSTTPQITPSPSSRGGHVLLATVRRAHEWAHLRAGDGAGAGMRGAAGTLVYAYHSPARPGTCVAFWDTRSGDRQVKTVRRLLAITVG